MRRLTPLAALLLAPLACSGGEVDTGPSSAPATAGASGAGADGGKAGLGGNAGASSAELVFETFGTNLYGAGSDFEQERRPAVIDAIARADADVLCVTDVLREDDKRAIVEAAKIAFPHSFWLQRDDATVSDDPRDLDGTAPEAPKTPPCTTDAQRSALEAGVSCAEMVCSSIPSDPSGHVTSLDCVSSKCSAALLPLLVGDRSDRRCASCLEAELASYATWSTLVSRCETEPSAGLAFGGQTDTLLLSKHPFTAQSKRSRVFPSSLFRRDVLRASIEVAGGVDVYCAHLQTAFVGSLVVYPGLYGGSLEGTQAWARENLVHATRLADYVKAETPIGRRAIVLGNLEASPQVQGSDVVLVSSNGAAATLDFLTPSPFTLGVAPTYQPVCTECSDNPLAQIAPPGIWTQHILLYGIEQARVTTTTRGFVSQRVDVSPPSGPTKVPLSSHTSIRSTVRL